MLKTPIYDFLKSYADKTDNIRCHMPGGKARYDNENAFKSDITEIYGAGSLYEDFGIISESERTAARLFGAKSSFYSAGGCTLPIQAMLSLIKKTDNSGKRKILAGRYSHRSLISTAVLLDLDIEFIYPDEYLSAPIKPEATDTVLKKICNGTLAVFFTGTDYYGGTCDVTKISRITDEYRIPLLIDNAHGAYRVFSGNHPIKQGALMVADSAHKTLPALTGAAYLHVGNSKLFNTDVLTASAKREMALFGSSSPSYLVLESLDLCNLHISDEKSRAESAFHYVNRLKQQLSEHGYTLRESDPLRIVINAKAYGYNGYEFAQMLRNASPVSVECEMCDENYTILLFSTITESWETEKTIKALTEIPRKKALPLTVFPVVKPRFALSSREAYYSESVNVPLEKAASRICSEICAPCPPGVPVIIPGEVFDPEIIHALKLYGVKEARVVKE